MSCVDSVQNCLQTLCLLYNDRFRIEGKFKILENFAFKILENFAFFYSQKGTVKVIVIKFNWNF